MKTFHLSYGMNVSYGMNANHATHAKRGMYAVQQTCCAPDSEGLISEQALASKGRSFLQRLLLCHQNWVFAPIWFYFHQLQESQWQRLILMLLFLQD